MYCGNCGTLKTTRSGELRCQQCDRTWGREYYHRSPARRENLRRAAVLRKYGVSLKFLETLLKVQAERCAICRRHWRDAPTKSRYLTTFLQHLFVDHEHVTGRVRGLLCNACNVMIAMMDEDPMRLSDLATYLKCFAQTANDVR